MSIIVILTVHKTCMSENVPTNSGYKNRPGFHSCILHQLLHEADVVKGRTITTGGGLI